MVCSKNMRPGRYFAQIYRIRARLVAATGSACGPGASPAPYLRQSAGVAGDAPHTRKYRRAARLGCLGCNGTRWSTRSSTAVTTGPVIGHRAPVTTHNRRLHRGPHHRCTRMAMANCQLLTAGLACAKSHFGRFFVELSQIACIGVSVGQKYGGRPGNDFWSPRPGPADAGSAAPGGPDPMVEKGRGAIPIGLYDWRSHAHDSPLHLNSLAARPWSCCFRVSLVEV
jgi:hypothetical protein